MWVWTVPLTTAGAPSPSPEAPWEPGMSRPPVLPPQPFPTPGSSPRKKGGSERGGRCSAPHTRRQLPPQTPGGRAGASAGTAGGREDEARGHGAMGRVPPVLTELAAVNTGARGEV